jgi:hypothetical protein
MQESIIFFILLTFLLIIFNAWYTAYKVCNQTKQAFDEFDLQLRRRLDLIAELIREITKHVKKNPLQKTFNDIAEKVNKASLSEISEIITKEMDDVLKSALKMIKKYPKIIPSSKLESIKRELEKVDKTIEAAKEAYFENVEFLQKWMGKFPFKRFKDWHFNVDKQQEKMESKKVVEEKKEHLAENEIDDFVASFKKKNSKKAKKSSTKTEKKKVLTKKNVKTSTGSKTKKTKK